jgi:soluble lytic murein transglycosylase-like protein
MRVTTNDCRRLIRRLVSIGFALVSSLFTPSVSAAQVNSRTNLSTSSAPTPQIVSFATSSQASSKTSETLADELRSTGISDEPITGVCRVDGRNEYIALIRAHAGQNALPPDIADAVTYIESHYRPEKIGNAGEVGLMQIRPATAAMLGFRGSNIELAHPATNIRYGVAYLARAWRLADGNLCRALMKYRAGHHQRRMTLLSRKYCDLAKNYLQRIRSSQAVDFSPVNPSPAIALISSR